MARVTGTQALTTTAIALPAQPCRAVHIRNIDGAISVSVGWNSTTQTYTLPAGQSMRVECANLNQIWAKGASGTPSVVYMTE